MASFDFDEDDPARTVCEQQEGPYPESILITCYAASQSSSDQLADPGHSVR